MKDNETKRSSSVLFLFHKVVQPVTHFVETIWAIGVGVVAGTVSIPIK